MSEVLFPELVGGPNAGKPLPTLPQFGPLELHRVTSGDPEVSFYDRLVLRCPDSPLEFVAYVHTELRPAAARRAAWEAFVARACR